MSAVPLRRMPLNFAAGRGTLPRSERRVVHMGRIWASVSIDNLIDPDKNIRCDALVDTGASHMVLPTAWRDRLGELRELATIEVETASQDRVKAKVCAPVQIQIEGFRPIVTEVLFIDMKPRDGKYIPLIGYIVLEQSQAAVDMLGHGLLRVEALDLR